MSGADGHRCGNLETIEPKRNWRKLGLIIGVLVVTALAIAVVGVLQLQGLNSRVQALVDVTVKEQSYASHIQLDLLRAIRSVNRGEAFLSPSISDAILIDYRRLLP